MRGEKRLAAAVRYFCQREFIFALILQRNGAVGTGPRDRLTQWRALLSDHMVELMNAATTSGIWAPDVDGAGILDRPVDPSGDDPLRAATINDMLTLAGRIAEGRS